MQTRNQTNARALFGDGYPGATFDCVTANQQAQASAAPGYYYAQDNGGRAESADRQPFRSTWEPLLERVPNCNGLADKRELVELTFLVVLDRS